MPTRTISKDIKDRIPILFHRQGFTVKEICDLLGIKKTAAYAVLRNQRMFGTTTNMNALKRGQRRILDANNLNFLRGLLLQQHTPYLDELQEALEKCCQIHVSIPTLVRTLQHLQYSSKQVSAQAAERNDMLRAAFMNQIALEVPNMDMIMFSDESAKDNRTDFQKQGWSPIGTHCIQMCNFIRGRRYSILPILTLDGIIAYDIIERPVTGARFLQFLQEMVVRVSCHIISSNFAIMLQLPLSNPYPGPQSVLILDNCALHHIEEVRALVEDEARVYLYIKSLNIANTHHDSHDAYRLQTDLFTALFSRPQSY
jgi:transposase